MPNAGDARAIYCPSCGASVEMDGDKGSCMYCGTVVERQASNAERPRFSVTQIKIESPPPSSYSTFNPPAVPGRRPALALGIVLSMVFVAAGIGIGLLLAPQPATRPPVADTRDMLTSVSVAPSPVAEVPRSVEIGSINELIAGLPRDGAGEDLLVYANNPNDQGISVALIDGGSQAVRWQSQPLSKQAYQGLLVAGTDMAYLTDEDRLLALRLSDGSLAWQATLVAAPNCDECLRLVKNHVVVLQKDGSLQGFDIGSGQRAWSVTIDDPPRRLPVVGDRLMLLQPVKGGVVGSFIDPASGKEVQRIEPTCPNTSFPGDVERPEAYSPFLFTADGKAMYTTFGFFSKCAQRWDLAGGKLAWQTALGDDVVPSSWDAANSPNLSESALFFGNNSSDEGTLWAMDTASGELRKVIAKKKYHFAPVAARDGIVIVLSWPNWDSKKLVLLGLDAKTGEQRWEFKPQAQDSRATDSHGHLDWRLTAKGLLLIQVLEEQQQLIVETLDPRTGASINKQTTALDGAGSHVFWSALWSSDMAWLDIGSSVYALDLATGATAYRLD